MAKAAVKPVTKPSNIAEIKPKNALPAEMQALLNEDYGKGVSTSADDNIVPFVGIVQTLSPQLKPRHEKFIKDAQVGMILLKGATPPVVDGENEGIVVQPCAFDKAWVEWVPRAKGGGFVTRHPYDQKPDDIVVKPDLENPKKMKMFRPNGNEIIETRYHFVLIGGAPYVIGFTSSGHTVSREWMDLMNKQKTGGKTDPSWRHSYRLTTKLRTKNDNEWFVFSAEKVDGWVPTTEEYLLGRALNKSVMAGVKVAAAEDGEEAPHDGDGDI
jgi:hypothetical protein